MVFCDRHLSLITFSRFIHIVADINTSVFLLPNSIPLYRPTVFYLLFVCLWTLAWFMHLVIMGDNAAMNTHSQAFVKMYIFISLIYFSVELGGETLVIFWLLFGGTAKLFSTVTVLIDIPTGKVQRCQFFHSFDACYYLIFSFKV